MDHEFRCKTINLLFKKQDKIFKIQSQAEGLTPDTKSTTQKRKKNDKLNLMKIENFCSAKVPVQRMKTCAYLRRKYVQTMYMRKDQHLTHIKNPKKSTVQNKQSKQKLGKRYEQTFHRRGSTDGKYASEEIQHH